MVALVSALALAVPSVSPNRDAVSSASAFLDAFESDPQSTRNLAVKDAVFVIIDMGGPFTDAWKGLGHKKTSLSACHRDSIRQTGMIPWAEVKELPLEAFKAPGNYIKVEAVYSCKHDDGRTSFIDVGLIMKDALMAMLSIVPRREREDESPRSEN